MADLIRDIFIGGGASCIDAESKMPKPVKSDDKRWFNSSTFDDFSIANHFYYFVSWSVHICRVVGGKLLHATKKLGGLVAKDQMLSILEGVTQEKKKEKKRYDNHMSHLFHCGEKLVSFHMYSQREK